MTQGFARLRLHSTQELQTWIATIEEAREELEELVGSELSVDLESLDRLEKFLLKRFKSVDAALTLDARGVTDAAARVVGTTLLLAIDGARWDINLDNPKAAYYRLPILVMPDGSVESPHAMVTASLDRRTGELLRGLVESWTELCDAPARPARKAPPRAKAAKRSKPSRRR